MLICIPKITLIWQTKIGTLRKGAEGSLFGLPQALLKSPLQAQIDAEGESAFNPSKAARLGARGVSFAADLTSMGGVYSWGSLGKLAGMEVMFAGVETWLDNKSKSQDSLTVGQCISSALWGVNGDVFETIRRTEPRSLSSPAVSVDFSDIPLVVAPEHAEEYRKWRAERQEDKNTNKNTMTTQSVNRNNGTPADTVTAPATQKVHTAHGEATQAEDNNSTAWSALLRAFGIDGIGDIGRNLPYVIATLPDMLVGLFTGKTESVGIKTDMVPMASILLGMFVKNPMLKLALIGLGGANLINKIGHESIGRREDSEPKVIYRQYADEPLNPRISNPVIRNGVLVATIDSVPCSVSLPENAVRAYESGALPLNTLANAVLDRHDRMKAAAMENYRNVEMEQTVQRDRGIGIR